jgi:hypothetical protein
MSPLGFGPNASDQAEPVPAAASFRGARAASGEERSPKAAPSVGRRERVLRIRIAPEAA